jgi:signal peptidase
VLPPHLHARPDPAQPEGTPSDALPVRVARHAGVVVHWAGNLLTFVAVLAFLGLAVGPHLLGYRTMTMLTGSMAPVIDPGDVIVDTEIPVGRLHVGDIITYQIPVLDRRVVSHRVMSIRRLPTGEFVVQTKGDANASNDPWQAVVTRGDVYKVRLVVPKIGSAIRVMRRPLVEKTLRFGGISLAVLYGLTAIWDRDGERKRKRSRQVAAEDARAPMSVDEMALVLLGEGPRPEPRDDPEPAARPALPAHRRPAPRESPYQTLRDLAREPVREPVRMPGRRPGGWESLNRRQPGSLPDPAREHAGSAP